MAVLIVLTYRPIEKTGRLNELYWSVWLDKLGDFNAIALQYDIQVNRPHRTHTHTHTASCSLSPCDWWGGGLAGLWLAGWITCYPHRYSQALVVCKEFACKGEKTCWAEKVGSARGPCSYTCRVVCLKPIAPMDKPNVMVSLNCV